MGHKNAKKFDEQIALSRPRHQKGAQILSEAQKAKCTLFFFKRGDKYHFFCFV